MTTPILAGLEADWHRMTERLHRHHQAVPAYDSTKTNQGGTMSFTALTELAAKAESGLKEAQGWIATTVEEHLPAITAEIGKLAGTQIGKALIEIGEAVLPPEDDAFIAAAIRFAARAAAAGVPAVPAVPVVPAEQMAEPQGEPA